MAQDQNTDQLYSRVRNASGQARAFGYLGVRGMRLANNEVVTVRGDLSTKLGNKLSARQFQALERDLLAGDLVIEALPAPILWDSVDEEPMVLALQNDVLGTVDPAWDASGSSLFEAG